MGLRESETHRLYSLPELITGTCTLGLPFREVSITLTGRELAVVKAAVNGEGRGDVVSSFDSFLCFDEKLVQTLLWEPHSIQPTPETDRDRRIRARGGIFRDGWLRLLLDLAPEGATYSPQGLGAWIATAELALDLGFDEHDTRDLLTHVAVRLNGRVDPDTEPDKAGGDDLDEDETPEGEAEPAESGYPCAPEDQADTPDHTAFDTAPATDEPSVEEPRTSATATTAADSPGIPDEASGGTP